MKNRLLQTEKVYTVSINIFKERRSSYYQNIVKTYLLATTHKWKIHLKSPAPNEHRVQISNNLKSAAPLSRVNTVYTVFKVNMQLANFLIYLPKQIIKQII